MWLEGMVNIAKSEVKFNPCSASWISKEDHPKYASHSIQPLATPVILHPIAMLYCCN